MSGESYEDDSQHSRSISTRTFRNCFQRDAGSGEDCRFTSSVQCEATASGIGAECYGNSFRGDEGFQGRRAGEYQGRIY
jgi:Protein of unknown function (DUF3551)